MNAAAGNAGVLSAALSCVPVQTSALNSTDDTPYGLRQKVVACQTRTPYYSHVPEKKGNRFGSLKSQKRTDRATRFFFVRMPLSAFYERRWRGSLRACWFSFVHQSSNPATCRPPRLEAGRGLTAQKEAAMSSTTTPKQFTLNADEARLVMAHRNMDARRAGETLHLAELSAIHHPRRIAPVFRLINGEAEAFPRVVPAAAARPGLKKSELVSFPGALRLAVCLGKAVSA